jgi:hypothetical protein
MTAATTMHRRYRLSGIRPVLLSLFITLFVAPVSLSSAAPVEPSSSPQAARPEGPSLAVTGYFATRYVFRTAETSSNITWRDQDIFGELRLDMTMPGKGTYEFHFFGAARSDLDGNRSIQGYHPLEDIGDTGSHSTIGDVYEAHLDLNNPVSRVSQVRLGRQAGTRDEQIYFDGIALDVRPAPKMNLTLYGGAAVHFWEISRSESDDKLAGAGIDLYPTSLTGISLDYLAVSDARNYLTFTDVRDKLISAKIWQRFGAGVQATAKVRYQDSDFRDATLRLLGSFPQSTFEFGAVYFRQFTTQVQQVNELSPFWDVMGQTDPYQTIELKMRKFLGTRYAVDLGYFSRTMLKSADTGTFNRDFSRATAAFTVSDLLTAGLSLTLSGDQWSSEGNDSLSGGADITYRFKKRGSISAGTYYSMYKYDDFFQLTGHDRIRTYYATIRSPLAQHWSLTAGYEFEKGIDTFTISKAGLRYDF